LTFARAGHDHPFLLRDGRVAPLGGGGMALGLFPRGVLTLVEESAELRPGDRLVLYTDGLTDVIGPDGEMLGRERLMALLPGYAERSPALMCRALFSELAALQGNEPQFDDMALLVVGVE